MELYSTMFHFGEGYIQRENEPPGELGQRKANPILYWCNYPPETSETQTADQKDRQKKPRPKRTRRKTGRKRWGKRKKARPKGHYRIIFEDTFDRVLTEAQAADFAITNGITYFGRKNLQAHASKMFAMIFDLDDVTDQTLNAFFSGCSVDAYPMPNYVVLSGHGVHLYYIFEEPVPLYPNIKVQLKDLKYALTERMWNPYTSKAKSIQRQGINQGFRIVGGKTKEGAPYPRARAFEMSNHPVSLTYLSRYVPKEARVDESKLFRESKMTLAQAKAKYPDWYEKVVVNKDKSRSRWEIEKKVHGNNPYALYDWWKNLVLEKASYKHRYFCIMCLAIYGVKCNVSYNVVKHDAYEMIPFLNSLNPAEPFTKEDVESALECYDLRYCTWPVEDVSKLTDIPIIHNKRNGRKQEMHMAVMRAIQATVDPDGKWRNKEGRPVGSGTKEKLVKDYIKEHPDASVTQIARDTGVSRPTVYKYMPKPDSEPIIYVIRFNPHLGKLAGIKLNSFSELTTDELAEKVYSGLKGKVSDDVRKKIEEAIARNNGK